MAAELKEMDLEDRVKSEDFLVVTKANKPVDVLLPYNYLAPATNSEERYIPLSKDQDYFPIFLRKVTVESGKSLGWPKGLLGLNYVGLGLRYARNDQEQRNVLETIAHEIEHDGDLTHGRENSEYLTRKIIAMRMVPEKPGRYDRFVSYRN
jgi:hypothetical protein